MSSDIDTYQLQELSPSIAIFTQADQYMSCTSGINPPHPVMIHHHIEDGMKMFLNHCGGGGGDHEHNGCESGPGGITSSQYEDCAQYGMHSMMHHYSAAGWQQQMPQPAIANGSARNNRRHKSREG